MDRATAYHWRMTRADLNAQKRRFAASTRFCSCRAEHSFTNHVRRIARSFASRRRAANATVAASKPARSLTYAAQAANARARLRRAVFAATRFPATRRRASSSANDAQTRSAHRSVSFRREPHANEPLTVAAFARRSRSANARRHARNRLCATPRARAAFALRTSEGRGDASRHAKSAARFALLLAGPRRAATAASRAPSPLHLAHIHQLRRTSAREKVRAASRVSARAASTAAEASSSAAVAPASAASYAARFVSASRRRSSSSSSAAA